jgi:hypothetical protein
MPVELGVRSLMPIIGYCMDHLDEMDVWYGLLEGTLEMSNVGVPNWEIAVARYPRGSVTYGTAIFVAKQAEMDFPLPKNWELA